MAINEDWVCIVIIELPQCGEDHGLGACTASGDACYRTWSTCQDKCNYSCGKKEFIYSTCPLPAHIPFCAEPIINPQSFTRSRIKPRPGESFSTYRYLEMELFDRPTDGQSLDPYFPRGMIPIEVANQPGTYLGRFKNLHKNIQGHRAIVLTGFCDQHISQFRREIYVVDEFNCTPHDCNGSGRLRLTDPLKLAGDAKCPLDSRCLTSSLAAGNEQLVYPTLGIDLDGDDDDEQPYLWQNSPILATNFSATNVANREKFSNVKYILIGSELIRVEACINDSQPFGYNLVLKERGVCGTEIGAHEAGARVKFAMHFENCHIVDVIDRLLCECKALETYQSLCCDDEQYALINRESFEKYRCNNPLQFIEFRVIVKPESIRKMLNKLELLFGFSLHTDPECGDIRIRDCRPVIPSGKMIMKEQIESISFNVGKSYQSIFIEYDPINCAQSLGDNNIGGRDLYVTEDALREPCDRRETRSINEFECDTPWFTKGNRFVLQASMDRFLKKHECPLRYPVVRVSNQTASMFAEDEGINIDHQNFQTASGENDTETVFRVVGIFPGKEYTDICLEEQPYDQDVILCLSDDDLIEDDAEPCALLDCPELY